MTSPIPHRLLLLVWLTVVSIVPKGLAVDAGAVGIV